MGLSRLTNARLTNTIMQLPGGIIYIMNYKLIVKTSSRHRSRIDSCLKTWLSGMDYIFITDNLLGDVGPEFSASTRTDYSSNEEKTVNFINHCKTNNLYIDYDWLVFIDDDAIINRKHLEYILPYFHKDYVYGLRMGGSWPKDTSLDFPSGGSGYFISTQLVHSMSHMTIHGHGQEDVSMGEWLRENEKKISDSFIIDNKNYSLKLNGWYPFSDIKERSCLLIDEINQDKQLFLKKHLTHHYIRECCLMDYIYNLFKEWTPKYMVLS